MKLKTLLTLSTFAISYFLFAMPSSATVICEPIYGGGEVCIQEGKISIDKKIQNIETGVFEDDLSLNGSPRFFQDDTIVFRLTVTNTGEQPLSAITVTDILPNIINLNTVASAGQVNSDGTVTFQMDGLNPNESVDIDLSAKINQVGSDACFVNQAIAKADKQASQDNAKFCVAIITEKVQPQAPVTTKGGLKVFPSQPVTKAPATGPEMLSLIGLIPAGFAGRFLRKKSLGK